MLDVEVMLEWWKHRATGLFASGSIESEEEEEEVEAGVLNDSLTLAFGGKKLRQA